MKTFLRLVGDIVAVVALPRESEGGHDNIALSSGRRERERGRGGLTHERSHPPASFRIQKFRPCRAILLKGKRERCCCCACIN